LNAAMAFRAFRIIGFCPVMGMPFARAEERGPLAV